MRKNIYIAMGVILASGFSCGYVIGTHFAERRFHRMIKEGPMRLEAMMTGRLVEKLRLSPQQVPLIEEAARRLAADYELAFKTHRREMEEHANKVFADIRSFLEPWQQDILDRMTADDLRPRPPRPPASLGGAIQGRHQHMTKGYEQPSEADRPQPPLRRPDAR